MPGFIPPTPTDIGAPTSSSAAASGGQQFGPSGHHGWSHLRFAVNRQWPGGLRVLGRAHAAFLGSKVSR